MKRLILFLAILWPMAGIGQNHPWQMFNGAPHHRGAASVSGPQTATLKWRYQLDVNSGNFYPKSVAISSTGTVYVAGLDSIFAFSPDGQLQRRLYCKRCAGPALSNDGSTIYATSDSSLVAMDTLGASLWSYHFGDKSLFGCTVGSDGTIYKGSWGGDLYAFDSGGNVLWSYPTAGCISYTPTLGPDGMIYQGGGDAHCYGGTGEDSTLYAINPNGSLHWAYATGPFNRRTGTPAFGQDGLIYVPTGTALQVLDTSGALQWSLGGPGDEISGIISPAIADDGTIYTGNSAGQIFAIDPVLEDTIWSYQTGPNPAIPSYFGVLSFFLADAQGTVFAGSVDHKMYAIDRNGNLKWSYETDSLITESAPAIGPDGTLYFTSEDGYVYAIADSLGTGVASSGLQPDLRVYPNPVQGNGILTVEVNAWGELANRRMRFDMLDMQGRTVLHDHPIDRYRNRIPLPGLTAGTYFYRLHAEGALQGFGKILVVE